MHILFQTSAMLNLAFKIVDYASNDFPLVKIYSVCVCFISDGWGSTATLSPSCVVHDLL